MYENGRKFILIWLTSFGILSLIMSLASGMPRLVWLSRRNVTVAGVVVEVQRLQHQSVTVEYLVGGKIYRQVFAPYPWRKGASVSVYYDPNDPRISVIEDPTPLLRSSARGNVFGAVFLATAFASFVMFARRCAFVTRVNQG